MMTHPLFDPAHLPPPNTFRPVPNMISVWESNVYVKFCLFTLLLGRWVKIDMHQDPAQFLFHFLDNFHSNFLTDCLPVYKSDTRKVSYKIFQIKKLQNTLDEQRPHPMN